ncbi:hypothetical protein ACS0TY_014655 [Phlomoides rotata]
MFVIVRLGATLNVVKEAKLSFPEDNLRENVGTFVNALLLAKPAGLKKRNSGGRGSRFDEKSRKVPNFDQH